MLIDDMRRRRTEAFKARDIITKETLNVAIGEIDTIARAATARRRMKSVCRWFGSW
ncbi:MAG: hypothetical protein HC802_14175 [Caldilineaceae bacterium]|nr:hypothetical protein [Caldilineaceae bacterium]